MSGLIRAALESHRIKWLDDEHARIFRAALKGGNKPNPKYAELIFLSYLYGEFSFQY